MAAAAPRGRTARLERQRSCSSDHSFDTPRLSSSKGQLIVVANRSVNVPHCRVYPTHTQPLCSPPTGFPYPSSPTRLQREAIASSLPLADSLPLSRDARSTWTSSYVHLSRSTTSPCSPAAPCRHHDNFSQPPLARTSASERCCWAAVKLTPIFSSAVDRMARYTSSFYSSIKPQSY